MAFITDATGTISFAEYSDVVTRDLRVFEANEGINVANDVEDDLIKSTNRIVSLLSRSTGITIDINSILARQDDFTDICVYHTLYEYIFPRIADFGDDQNAERIKIDFYRDKFDALMQELVEDGDWYDLTGDSAVTDADNISQFYQLRRVR